ncbi:MAG: hypothetical protein JNL67_10045 [Planctomycetaceae bacterium]|nr:hypothetical protein [Planctomycetaceae bacterium]
MRFRATTFGIVAYCLILASLLIGKCGSMGQEPARVHDGSWRYTLDAPAAEWMKPDFQDGDWSEASGGFGTPGTPASRIGTVWNTREIWLRRQTTLASVPQRIALLIHHDEDATVYLNGSLVASLVGFTTNYRIIELGEAEAKLARVGENLLAIHCRQTGGGQYIDAHLIDAAAPPELLPVQRSEVPFKSQLITPWGESLDRKQPWPEYPRPAFQRANWMNLNGPWQYSISEDQVTAVPDSWDGTIVVPFALESLLSGVQRLLKPSQCLWYRRTFEYRPHVGQRTLLNFEAVDYECRVFVNGKDVGGHRGGHTPFTLDVTAAVRDGENELIVRVIDRTEMMQLRGKQTLDPSGIWYTQVSGIWQTVWLEWVPETYFESCLIQTESATGTVTLTPRIIGAQADAATVRYEIRAGQQVVASGKSVGGKPITIQLPQPRLWSPRDPFLYDVELELLNSDGGVGDRVASYVGIRSVGKVRDEQGHWRLTLNGEPVFHWGPLDQGWWPDGLLTPPSDAALRFDVDYLKQAGFNMIRKHIKVEPRRFYEYCDRVGMMVWQDQVSGGHGPPWTRLAPLPIDAEWSDKDHAQYLKELDRMITSLENHPCIVMWVPFNEAWGQHRTTAVGNWTRKRDPSRLVNIASGGNFWPVGDVVDHHEYPHPAFPFARERDQEFVMVVGEFGGHGLPIRGHLWNPEMDNWGYGGLPQNADEYFARYEESLRRLGELQKQGIAAGVYTQTTDVEGEINGLMTYDRKVLKIPAQRLRELSEAMGIGQAP